MPRIKTKTVEIDDAEVQAALAQMDAAVVDVLESALEAGAKVALTAALRRAPGQHVIYEVDQKQRAKRSLWINLGPDKKHWFYQFYELGWRAHTIKAKKKKFLKFEGREALIFLKSANIPAGAARPFLRPALDENQETIKAAVGEALRSRLEAIRA